MNNFSSFSTPTAAANKSNFKKRVAKHFTDTTFFRFESQIDKQLAYVFSDPMAKAVFWVAHPSRKIICDPECQIYLKKPLLNDPEVEFVSKDEAHRRRAAHGYSLCSCCAGYFPADPLTESASNKEVVETNKVMSCCMYVFKYICGIDINETISRAQETRPTRPERNDLSSDPPQMIHITWLVCMCLAYNAYRSSRNHSKNTLTTSSVASIAGVSYTLLNRYFSRYITLSTVVFEQQCRIFFGRPHGEDGIPQNEHDIPPQVENHIPQDEDDIHHNEITNALLRDVVFQNAAHNVSDATRSLGTVESAYSLSTVVSSFSNLHINDNAAECPSTNYLATIHTDSNHHFERSDYNVGFPSNLNIMDGMGNATNHPSGNYNFTAPSEQQLSPSDLADLFLGLVLDNQTRNYTTDMNS